VLGTERQATIVAIGDVLTKQAEYLGGLGRGAERFQAVVGAEHAGVDVG
jgi:hypothetical protein